MSMDTSLSASRVCLCSVWFGCASRRYFGDKQRKLVGRREKRMATGNHLGAIKFAVAAAAAPVYVKSVDKLGGQLAWPPVGPLDGHLTIPGIDKLPPPRTSDFHLNKRRHRRSSSCVCVWLTSLVGCPLFSSSPCWRQVLLRNALAWTPGRVQNATLDTHTHTTTATAKFKACSCPLSSLQATTSFIR